MQQSNPGERRLGIVCVLMSAIFFATGGLLIKLNSWNAVTINGVRSLLALSVMLLYMKHTGHHFRFNKAVLFGTIANSGMTVTFTIATKMTTAANAIVLQFMMPAFVVVLLWIFWKQKPDGVTLATVAVSLLGMACFFIDSLSAGNMAGNLIAMLSGFLYAFVFLMKQIPGADFMSSVVISYGLNFLIGLPFLLQETDFGASNLITIVLLGIVQVGFSYVCLDIGLDRVPPVAASLISMIEPILNPIMVAVFYHEMIGPIALVGAAIVLGSATFSNLYSLKKG